LALSKRIIFPLPYGWLLRYLSFAVPLVFGIVGAFLADRLDRRKLLLFLHKGMLLLPIAMSLVARLAEPVIPILILTNLLTALWAVGTAARWALAAHIADKTWLFKLVAWASLSIFIGQTLGNNFARLLFHVDLWAIIIPLLRGMTESCGLLA
jgi:hypothetical protein